MLDAIGTIGTAAALLQATPDAGQAPNPFISFLVPMGLILIIFYFLLIRPANKKQKALQSMIEGLKNGDKIITTGGIRGVVAGIDDEVIHLKVAPNVKIEISRSAVSALQSEKGE